MFRFLATLALTVVAIVAATAWWTDEAPAPAPIGLPPAASEPEAAPGGDTLVAPEAGRAVVSTPAAPRGPARPPAPAPARAAAKPEPIAAIPAPPRRVPAIPAPRLAAERTRPLPAIAAPRIPTLETIEETSLPDSPFFEAWTDDAPIEALPADPGFEEPFDVPVPVEVAAAPESEREPALPGRHDRSASLIRRLLDVYQDLGRRP